MLKGPLQEFGLVKYLNATKALHRNNGYKEFAAAMQNDEARTKIADTFGVGRSTVYEWIKLFEAVAADAPEIVQ